MSGIGLICRWKRHQPGPNPVWNDGWFFSRCGRCGAEILGDGIGWRLVPRGYRVVWKPKPAGYPSWGALQMRRIAAALGAELHKDDAVPGQGGSRAEVVRLPVECPDLEDQAHAAEWPLAKAPRASIVRG